ncbi:MAG: TonB-dependent receptor [Capnocytophaga sp.]|nr:TonB-dependent receptor [Capnocytophaga sp.]
MAKQILCILLTFVSAAFAQPLQAQTTVSGTVTDDQGVPLPGVSVLIKSTTQGVATDFDGKYSIEAQNGNILVFSSIGFTSQEIKVDSKSTIINVLLKEDTQQLDEVVIIGYGTARRRDLTGSVTSIRPTEELAATSNSIDNLLQGRVAGVNIATAGSTPGAAASIVIRGANSLTGDSQPLYVIDNVPQSSTGQTMRSGSGDFQLAQDPLANLNPNDIADIQILKDASATAIYGSRGANGVILITTKRGKEGKAKITYSTNVTMADAVDLIPLMDLTQYASYFNTILPGENAFEVRNDGRVFYTYVDSDTNTSFTEQIHNRNWLKEALRTAFSTTHNINVNGGSQKMRYNISAGYKDVEGIVHNTGLKHGDFRINLGVDLTERLSANIIANGFLRENNMMPGGNTVGRTSGAIIPTAINTPPYLLPDNDSRNQGDVRTTVLSWVTDFDDITNEHQFSLSGDVTYRFHPDVSYTFRAGGNLNNVERTNWYGISLFKGGENNGFLSQSILKRNNYNVENLLNYNKTFGSLNIGATVGATYDAYKWLNTNISGVNFPYYVFRTNGLHTAGSITADNPLQRDYQLLSYLGRLNLSFFNGRYVLTGTFRTDGTSKFSESNRWAYFPSFAAAWNVKEEPFLATADFLSQFKLRAGYGVTGSQNINPYVTIFGYGSQVGYATPDGTILKGLTVSVNNPDLKWETTSSVNGGLDFGLFDNRVSGTVELYNKTTKDLLINISLPGSTSFSSLAVNNGEISNKGFEAMLNTDLIRSKDLTWNIGGNIAFNTPKIVKLGVPEGTFATLGNVRAFLGSTIGDHFGSVNIFAENHAPGLFYGYKTDGLIQEDEAVAYAATLESPFTAANGTPGNLKYVDTNGDGKVNTDDLAVIGDPNPDFLYGFQTSVRYKNARFSATFTGVKGGDILNTSNRYHNMAFQQNGGSNLNPKAFTEAWTTTNTDTRYPALRSSLVNGIINDRYVEDGSYLRCTDITAGYTLNLETLKTAGIRSVDLYLSVKNAFTITDYSGFDVTGRSFNLDPLRRGIDAYAFPTQRAFILGASISF